MAKTEVTRLALLKAAERLFAERGVDNVSMREIAAVAGQKNHSAAVYHFGDKRELLEALLHRHSGPIDDRFVPALDRLRELGTETLTAILALLVHPLVAKLDDEDGGADYALICSELVTSRTFPMTALRAANEPGSMILRQRLVAVLGPLEPILLPVRMMQFTALLFGSIASYHRFCAAGLYIPRELFAKDLVETLAAVLESGI